MGFDQGAVMLDSINLAYFAGQTIFGRLEFQQEKVKTFRGIYVKARGFAHVHWSTTRRRKVGDRYVTDTINHDADEEYFNVRQYLIGSSSGEQHLQPGSHVFPFQIHIPSHCPSSFEGAHGHIRYELTVVVDRAFKFDQEKYVRVRVIAPLDLNAFPQLKDPIEMPFEDSYYCCCSSSGKVETRVKVPVSGFCPGQVIPVEVCCENNSNVAVHSIKLIIKKLTTFYAHMEPGTKHESDVVLQVKKDPVPAHSSKTWTVNLEIPNTDCNIDACRIMDLDYLFKVKVSPDGCHSGSSAERGIRMGTVPLKGYFDDQTNPLFDQMPQQQPVQNVNAGYPTASQPFPAGHQPYPPPPAGFPAPNHPYPAPPAPGFTPAPPPPYPGNNNPPYPGGNPPYPGEKAPYPGEKAPYPGGNPPYPGGNPPYPGGNPPYPTGMPVSPGEKSSMNTSPYHGAGEKSEGVIQQHPAPPSMPMPQAHGAPAPWASPPPSAPAPGTPDPYQADKKSLLPPGDSHPPYNPHYPPQ